MFSSIPLPKAVPDVRRNRFLDAYQDVGDVRNELRRGELTNKLMPLKSAIDAQNALNTSSRSGGIGLFLRSIAQMPVAERQAYLADPTNNAQYNEMLEEFKRNMKQGGGQQQVITPESVRSILGGISNDFGGPEGSNAMASAPQAIPQQANAFAAPPPRAQAPSAQNAFVDESLDQPIDREGEQKPLSDKERRVYYSQHLANMSSLTPAQKNRMESATIFENWLNDNQDQYASRIESASRYAGAMGRGKKYADMMKKEQPDAYNDYQWYENTFRPSVVNQVKMMEKMSSSNSQREELHGMLSSMDSLSSNPKSVLRQINQGLGTLGDISDSVFRSSEPRYPGAYHKLTGMKERKGAYVNQKAGAKKKFSPGAYSIAKDLKLPQFNSKEEYQAWFKKQPTVTQEAVIIAQGGG